VRQFAGVRTLTCRAATSGPTAISVSVTLCCVPLVKATSAEGAVCTAFSSESARLDVAHCGLSSLTVCCI
jgi:hypothetical protein